MARRSSKSRGFRTSSAEQRRKEAQSVGMTSVVFLRPDVSVFSPADDLNIIRFVPPLDGDKLADMFFGMSIITHWLKGARLCLKSPPFNEKHCPICDAFFEARKVDSDQASRFLKQSKRILTWLLDMNKSEDDPDLKVWSMPTILFEEVRDESTDRRTGELLDVNHPDTGRIVTFRKKTGSGVPYKGLKVEDEEPLPDWVEEDIEFFEDIMVLDYDVSQYEDLAAEKLDEIKSGDSSDGDDRSSRRSSRSKRDEDEDEDKPRGGSRSRRSRRDEEEEEEEDEPRSRKRRGSRDDDDDGDKSRGGSRRRSRRDDDDDDDDDDDTHARVKEKLSKRQRRR